MLINKVNIIGDGAIGHLWTCFLNRHGFHAQLYARQPKSPRQINIVSPLGNFDQLVSYQCLNNWKNPELILICVKAHNLQILCQTLAELALNSAPIILMMNGMGLVQMVERYLPNQKVLHASLIHGADLSGNQLKHTGKGLTLLGNLSTNYPAQNFTSVVKLLDSALPQVRWNDDHLNSMMLKCIVNAIINPVTALYNIRNGDLIKNNQLITQCEQLLIDIEPLLSILNSGLTIKHVREKIIYVAQNTATNFSSMLKDRNLRKPTEIEFINGYLVELARVNNLELIHHVQIIKQIKQIKQFKQL